jgi:predicted nucleotidyltransferase
LLQAEYRDIAAEYAQRVKEHFGDRLVSICFFGSVARGEASPDSDVDVLAIAERLPKDYGLRVRDTNRIHESLRKEQAYRRLRSEGRSAFISDVYLTPEEARSHPPILLDVADHGVIVYDKEGFLAGVLEDIRERLRQLGGRRIRARKGYYWVLKPDAKPTEVIEI